MLAYNNVLETIGNTPLVRINKLAPDHVNLFVKLEYFNPMGSVKDRMALAIIEEAERSGALKPGQTVIEATSGNTGIGLAMVCAQKGYPLVVTMMESASIERRKLLRFLGARVVLTPASEKGSGMLRKAEELAAAHGYFLACQFDNEANARVHRETTAHEILRDFAGTPLHYWVSGFGTGGTVSGVAQGIKAVSPTTRIVVAEPDNAQLLGSAIRQVRDAGGGPAESHPGFRPHLMQGWTPDFISSLMEAAVTGGWVDQTVPVAGNDALRCSRQLALHEGIFAGITSGATLAAGLDIARNAAPGTNIVCMVPDTGERYLSTPLFEHIGEEMDEEELALSESTPLCQFREQEIVEETTEDDADAMSKDARLKQAQPADARTEQIVQRMIDGDDVVIFALEWCEFSWAAKKLFTALDIPFRSIELDSKEMQTNDLGGSIRKSLRYRTGSPTIPQIYVGGELLGGNAELFAAYQDHSLQRRLRFMGKNFNEQLELDVSALLPRWLQPRKSA